jgi:hypothetical protein
LLITNGGGISRTTLSSKHVKEKRKNERGKFKNTKMISIRAHCIPAYDELSRMRNVKPIPTELDSLEEKTAGGIVLKIKKVIDSEYFASLPNTAIIESGAVKDYEWKKSEAKKEADRIYSECKDFIKMSEFKQFRRKQIAELRPFQEGEQLSEIVSVSKADKDAGSPKVGDMIARNPKNHEDQWLVEKQYFEDNFEPVV